jgi:hypothetical protein
LHNKFLTQHGWLVYEDMEVLQKHVMLDIIFCILFCDVRLGFIFKYFVIWYTPVLGDDFIFENSKKTYRDLQEGPKL